MLKIKLNIVLFAVVASISLNGVAGVVLGQTRVIFNEGKKDASVFLRNTDKTPYLVQSWVDIDVNLLKTAQTEVPFVVTPPLFRLNQEGTASIRIVKRKDLPVDKESVFYLNVKAVPPVDRDAENTLNFSHNNRIKLFYRPAALKDLDGDKAFSKLKFSMADGKLKVENPTPFHVTVMEVRLNESIVPDSQFMISPNDSLVLPANKIGDAFNVVWIALSDTGTPVVVDSKNK